MNAIFSKLLIGFFISVSSHLAFAQSNDTKLKQSAADGPKATPAQSTTKTTPHRIQSNVANQSKAGATDKLRTDALDKTKAGPIGSHDEAGCHSKDSDA